MTWLNLGCGNDVRTGWVNVDQHMPRDGVPDRTLIREPGEGCGPATRNYTVFVRADLLEYLLELDANVADRALLDNVLEHVDRPLIVLRELARVCRPGARVVVRVPHKLAPGANVLTHTWAYSRESLRPVTASEGGLENANLYDVEELSVFHAFPGAWLLEDVLGVTLPIGRPQRIEWILRVRG